MVMVRVVDGSELYASGETSAWPTFNVPGSGPLPK